MLSDQELAAYKTDCDQEVADQDFIVIAANWRAGYKFGTASKERVQLARAQQRISAIQEFSLGDWRQAILATYAATFGWHDEAIEDLLEACYRATKMASSAAAIAGFVAATHRLDVSYLDRAILSALESATRPESFQNQRRFQITRAAAIAGLKAENTKWEFKTLGDHTGYWQEREIIPTEEFLASGMATFKPVDVPNLLRYWEGMANRRGKTVPLPETLMANAVQEWAEVVRSDASTEEEGPPNSTVLQLDSGDLLLGWEGRYTPGRLVCLVLHCKNEGVERATLGWHSATGEPSRWLSVEELLALPGRDTLINCSPDF